MNSTDLNPESFIRDLIKPSVSVDELKNARKLIQSLSDETNAQLKKNVYKNYALFIETAKEISYLKNEMFTLQNLLSEQQSLFSSLQEISISGDKKDIKYQDERGFSSASKTQSNQQIQQNSITASFSKELSFDKNSPNISGKKTLSPMEKSYPAFEDSELIEDDAESDTEVLPLWLTELSEDLDVCIAQRNFEEAVTLVNKVNDHFVLFPKCCEDAGQPELKSKISSKIEELVKAISKELEIVPDRPIQNGPRSARRAVNLLVRLGKSSLSTELFLNQRSAILRYCLMQQKKEGATLQYIERMSSVFFNNVTETCKEFEKAFGVTNTSAFASMGTISSTDSIILTYEKMNGNGFSLSLALACLVSWVQCKLNDFLDSFCLHVFTTQVSYTIAAECVSIVYHQCKRLRTNVHIDLIFFFDQKLKHGIERLIIDCRDKLLESIKHRASNDKWQPTNHGNKGALSKFLEEMKDCGLNCIQNYVCDEVKISLTSNTIAFAKSYLNTLRDLLKLSTPFTHGLVIEAIVLPFKAQLKHIEKSLEDEKFMFDKRFINRNASFLIDTLLSLASQYYVSKFGTSSSELISLAEEFVHLKGEDKKRNICKVKEIKFPMAYI